MMHNLFQFNVSAALLVSVDKRILKECLVTLDCVHKSAVRAWQHPKITNGAKKEAAAEIKHF